MGEGGYFLLNTDGGMANSGDRVHDEDAGEAAIGVVLKRVNKNNNKELVVESFGRRIGRKMNDVAEYEGLFEGLKTALDHQATRIRAYMDSEFVVEQVNNDRKPKEADLVPLHREVQRLIGRFAVKVGFRLSWIPRARNSEADQLARNALEAET